MLGASHDASVVPAERHAPGNIRLKCNMSCCCAADRSGAAPSFRTLRIPREICRGLSKERESPLLLALDGCTHGKRSAAVLMITAMERSLNGTLLVSQTKLRLDTYLSARLPDVSRSQLQHGIKLGLVTVNGKVHVQSHKNVRPGDVVLCSLPPPPVTTAIPQVHGAWSAM